MVVPRYFPRRGDFIWLNFTPQAGHEQSGRRSALVISHNEYNRKVGLLLACPLTTQQKGYPFEVLIPVGLPVSGVILADQVRSLDWRMRQALFIAKAPEGVLAETLSKLGALTTESDP
ncbi:MAG TPA: type II toxin-antitoxin system PemK/MazF family toxin [Verrucomicrobiae bacterium]